MELSTVHLKGMIANDIEMEVQRIIIQECNTVFLQLSRENAPRFPANKFPCSYVRNGSYVLCISQTLRDHSVKLIGI